MQRKQQDALLHKARNTITGHQMLVPGERVLVALSGGPDSVALLAALVALSPELGIQVCAAHVNHGWRGPASDRDEAHAADVARELGVIFRTKRLVSASAPGNWEEHAREHRYRLLREIAAQLACAKIATGHTRDDQAETVLMRLLRGSGLDGLAGIPPVREEIVRPLLDCERTEVMRFLAANGLRGCEDGSNRDSRFLRNRLRLEVLPGLEALRPGVRRRLAATARVARAEARRLDAALLPTLFDALDPLSGTLARSSLLGVEPELRGRLLRLWLRQRRGHLRQLQRTHIQAIEHIASAARPNARVDLPGGESVRREYERLAWYARATLEPPCEGELDIESPVRWFGWQLHLGKQAPGHGWDRTLLACAVDGDAVGLPLRVRSPRPGDRVHPLGMQGRKKLQDCFVDRRVPASARQQTPIVEAGGHILWIPGVVRSRLGLVTAATTRTLWLVAEQVGIAGA